MEQRHCVVLQGELAWRNAACRQLLSAFDIKQIVEITTSASIIPAVKTIPSSKAKTMIGQEHDAIIVHLNAAMSADSLGIVIGTIRAGGVLLICLDTVLAESPWQQRFNRITQQYCLQNSPFYWLCEGDALPNFSPPQSLKITTTQAQQEVIYAVVKVATGRRRRPLVVTADRGRGKSAALGLAAATLLQQGKQRIIVTAPSLAAARMVFKHAARTLACEHDKQGYLHAGDSELCFMAPDALLQSDVQADLLMVDEAAAIPSLILSQLLSRFARIVFASTLHGYEGTGRGFAVRFFAELAKQTPHWQHQTMTMPVRWRADDVMEAWSFDALLLHAEPISDEVAFGLSLSDCECRLLSAEQLLANETLLRRVFGLLVLAHYRTRPSDLQLLLDQSDMRIFILSAGDAVVGCAWLVQEGELDTALSKAVYSGTRRVSGQLLPQSLLAHAGLLEAGQCRYQRIIRLAIHPALQRQGLGHRFVTAISEHVSDDVIGASFAADPDILAFWITAGFQLVRLGVQRDEVSGAYAAILLKGQSAQGQHLVKQATLRFSQQWDDLLITQFSALSVEMAVAVAQSLPAKTTVVDEWMWDDVIRFSTAKAGYAFCQVGLRQYVQYAIRKATWLQLDGAMQSILVQRVLQGKAIAEIVSTLSLTGKAVLDERLREAVAQLVLLSPKQDMTTSSK